MKLPTKEFIAAVREPRRLSPKDLRMAVKLASAQPCSKLPLEKPKKEQLVRQRTPCSVQSRGDLVEVVDMTTLPNQADEMQALYLPAQTGSNDESITVMSNSINAVQECLAENRQLRSEIEAIKQELAAKDRQLASKQSQVDGIEQQIRELWEALRIEQNQKSKKQSLQPRSLKAQYEMLQKNRPVGTEKKDGEDPLIGESLRLDTLLDTVISRSLTLQHLDKHPQIEPRIEKEMSLLKAKLAEFISRQCK